MSKKRRRERPAVNVELVEIYEDLASVDEEIRLKAAHLLLTKFVSNTLITGEQLDAILRRLIRGLCSGRKAARLGFSTTLTEFLSGIFGPNGKFAGEHCVSGFADIKDLSAILVEETKVGGNVAGQEERDYQFGRLFGVEAFIKSGILFQANVDKHLWSEFLEIVFALAQQKPWLREQSGFILFKAVEALKGKQSFYIQEIIDKLHIYGLDRSPEGIAIWIAAKENVFDVQLPSNVWRNNDPLDRKEMSSLAKILKEGAVTHAQKEDSPPSIPQMGFWSTQIHFAWDIIVAKFFTSAQKTNYQTGSKVTKAMSFEDFWTECVDSSLFAIASSEERKSWGFLLAQKTICNAPQALFARIFTKNFMRCLVNQLRSSERFLHRAAEKTVKSLLARTASEPECRIFTLRALLAGPYGNINFDEATRTKTIETLLSQMNESDCGQSMIILDELLLKPGSHDEKAAASTRLTLANHLASALRNQHVENSDSESNSGGNLVIHSILELLAKFAYFDLFDPENHRRTPDPPFSLASRQICRTRISSCLGQLLAKSNSSGHFIYDLIRTLRKGERLKGFRKPLIEFDSTTLEVGTKAWEIVDRINLVVEERSPKPSNLDANYMRSITLLYSLTILQTYNEDPEAVGVLEELNDLFGEPITSHDSAQSSAALVEIMLAFTSKPSQLFRQVVQQVFKSCSSDIDKIGLTSMIEVLGAKENLAGQEQIFAREEDDDDKSSKGSDIEEPDISAINSAPSESHVEESDEEVAIFEAKLAQTLGSRPGINDTQANDSSSSDEDMNDEQMEALDGPLEKVFQERKKLTSNKKSKKTEQKAAKETVVNFKCKVLELLIIYIRQQHKDPLALNLLLPVLVLIRTTTTPRISRRACDLLEDYTKICKKRGLPKVEDTRFLDDLLEQVHTEVGIEASNAHTSACSRASLLLVKILVAHDSQSMNKAIDRYASTKEKASTRPGFKVRPAFFEDWKTWRSSKTG